MDLTGLRSQCRINAAEVDSDIIVKGTGMLPYTTVISGREIPGTLNDVMFIPSLRYNLMSVKKIVKRGGRVTFDDKGGKILFGDRLVAVAGEIGNLYWVTMRSRRGEANQCQSTQVVSGLASSFEPRVDGERL